MIQLLDLPNEIIYLISDSLDSHNLNSFIKTNHYLSAVLTPLLNKRAIRGLPLKLIDAAAHGYEHLTKLLLDNGANVNAQDESRRTALSSAIGGHHLSVAKLLLEGGADADILAEGKYTVLGYLLSPGYARYRGYDPEWVEEAVELLLDSGAGVNTKAGPNRATPLCIAAEQGRMEIIKLLLERGADPTAKDKNGDSVLTYATCSQSRGLEKPEALVELLLDNGADINSQNLKGHTPFFGLATSSRIDVVKLLANLKAQSGRPDVTIRNNQGRTVLHSVVSKNLRKDVLELLLRLGVDVGAVDNEGKTALHCFAVSRSCVEVGQLLVDSGSDLDARDFHGDTGLHWAVVDGRLERTEFFLDNGADVNALNDQDETPLQLAVRHHAEEAVKAILDKRPYTDVREGYSEGNLEIAVENGSSEIVKLLLEKGIDTSVQRKKDYGCRSLYNAAMDGKEEIVRLLFRAGVDICFTDAAGNTVLHIATQLRQCGVVEVLLEDGVWEILDCRNADGETALDLAVRNGYIRIAGLLTAALSVPVISR